MTFIIVSPYIKCVTLQYQKDTNKPFDVILFVMTTITNDSANLAIASINSSNTVTMSEDLKSIFFPVKKVKYNGLANNKCEYDVIAFTDNGQKRLATCADRYELTLNRSIYMPILDIFDDLKIEYASKVRNISDAQFFVDFTIEGYDTKLGNTNDVIKPMLKFKSSYDGSKQFGSSLGLWRQVCANGLMLPSDQKSEYDFDISGKNTKAIIAKIKKMHLNVLNFCQNMRGISNALVGMNTEAVLNIEDRITEAMNFAGLNLIDNLKFNTLAWIEDIIIKEANDVTLGYNGKVTNWLVYNGINQYINSDLLNKKDPEKRAFEDEKVLNFLLQAV